MKTVFAVGKLHEIKYEGNRSVVQKVLDNWQKHETEIRDRLERYWDLVQGPHLEMLVLWPMQAQTNSLREWAGVDSEDQRVGLAHYIYGLWCTRAVVKHLTEPCWRLAAAQLEEHFWYAVGAYRGTSADTAQHQLAVKLELAPLGLSEFIRVVE
jgi:hypothetical protein